MNRSSTPWRSASAACQNALLVLACTASWVASAQEQPPAEPQRAEPAQPSEPAKEPSKPRSKNQWEGAIGLVLDYGPAFYGSSQFKLKPHLAGFVRYGRFTITGVGGFTTYSNTEVERGVAADVVRRDDLRVNLSLRADGGRKESDGDQLRGMGNIPATVRLRLAGQWRFAPGWALSAGTRMDILNRVGGAVMDLSLGHEWQLSPTSRLGVGWSVLAGSARYMQAWHGVTAQQSAASGYPEFRAGGGLRTTALGATWRHELGDSGHWALFATGSVSRQLGSAAKSPLTTRPTGWILSSGLARRF